MPNNVILFGEGDAIVLKYCNDDEVNTEADILVNAGHDEEAETALEHMNYAGKFDSAASLFTGTVIHYGITIPRKVYDELLSCYSLDPQDLDYSPDMYADVKAIEEAGLIEDEA